MNKFNIPINITNKDYINNSIDHFNINNITIVYKRVLSFDGYDIILTGIELYKKYII